MFWASVGATLWKQELQAKEIKIKLKNGFLLTWIERDSWVKDDSGSNLTRATSKLVLRGLSETFESQPKTTQGQSTMSDWRY